MLVVIGDARMSTHPLVKDRIVIGRADDCDVTIDHPSLSRRHAELHLGPPISIRDLGSTNGTRVGRDAHRGGDAVELAAREGFAIGPFSFVLVVERDPAAVSSPRHGAEVLRVDDPTREGVAPIVREIASSGTNVLVLGETGVGKELLADTVHHWSGRRGRFLRINCATLSEPLLESELFGHERGAFTGASATKPGLLEAANGGTVFLDEIGDLPPSLQPKLLRAVEAGEILRVGALTPIPIDVRFIAATHRDLVAEVGAGTFRADLFYRLDGVSLRIPPLRERTSQIGPLALRFLAGKGAVGTPQLIARLAQHAWPGNVRELKAAVERAALLARGAPVTPEHLVLATSTERAPAPAVIEWTADERADRDRIVAALAACGGNQTRAARHLGIARATLAAKLARYRVRRPRDR
jgi:transcriptional regulator with GAF, ATPase, and Fis domain